jgi:hypothetical protein
LRRTIIIISTVLYDFVSSSLIQCPVYVSGVM